MKEDRFPMRFAGSSPRARGTGGDDKQSVRAQRFIPARAGNGAISAARSHPNAVHPRARGERVLHRPSTNARSGSSPRARGTDQLA